MFNHDKSPQRSSSFAQKPKGVLSAFVCGALLLVPIFGHAQKPSKPHAKGHILVKFWAGAADMDKEDALSVVGAKAVHQLGHLPILQVDLTDNASEEQAVADLSAQPEVEYAELDVKLAPAQTPIQPNDPSLANQWFLNNINAPLAWSVTTGSPNLIVAILDSGCDPTHPDLMPNYVAGWNFYDNTSDTHDVNGHGTAVAGCVGAAGNNGLGIASVSWGSKIMPCRVADATCYAYYSTISTALQWAADHGAKIANISFQGVAGSSSIISAAQYMYSKGGLTVCAGGNESTNPGYAASPYMINVAATDSNNANPSWSNYGAYITVAAPGVNIYTTNNGGGYGGWSGTSFSSPITCGVLAEEWAANPGLSNAQVQQALVSSATDLGAAGWDNYYGYGKVDVYKAVLAAQSAVAIPPPAVAVTSPGTGSSIFGSVTVTMSATDSLGISKVELYKDGVLMSTLTSAPYQVGWNTGTVGNGSHTLMAKAYDAAGNMGISNNCTVNVNNPLDTTAPICAITSPSSGTKVSGGFAVAISGSDNVGITSVMLYLDGKQVASASTAPCSISLNARKWSSGTHVLVAIVSDAAGNNGTSASVTVTR